MNRLILNIPALPPSENVTDTLSRKRFKIIKRHKFDFGWLMRIAFKQQTIGFDKLKDVWFKSPVLITFFFTLPNLRRDESNIKIKYAIDMINAKSKNCVYKLIKDDRFPNVIGHRVFAEYKKGIENTIMIIEESSEKIYDKELEKYK